MTTNNNTTNYDLSPAGIKALMKTPIRATLSSLDFPYIRIEQQQDDNGKPFYIGILWLEMGNQIIIEMAGATAFKEALAIIAYQQQMTVTPLLIDDDVAESVKYFNGFSQYQKGVNPLIEHRTGQEITLEMMTKQNRDKVDLFYMEQRIERESKRG